MRRSVICLSTEKTRTSPRMITLVVTISQVSLWSSALWLCRGLEGLRGKDNKTLVLDHAQVSMSMLKVVFM